RESRGPPEIERQAIGSPLCRADAWKRGRCGILWVEGQCCIGRGGQGGVLGGSESEGSGEQCEGSDPRGCTPSTLQRANRIAAEARALSQHLLRESRGNTVASQRAERQGCSRTRPCTPLTHGQNLIFG